MPLLSLTRDRRRADFERDLEEILDILHRHDARVEDGRIRDAFELALQIHGEQKRKDGQPYIIHPLSVAHTCAEHWMNDVGVAAALLHDTLEDADKKMGLTEQVLEERFGSEVSHIVKGVTKLERNLGEDGRDHRAETLKRLMHATALEDIRIIILKIFDRYHNVQTLGVFGEEKSRRIGEETMRFYVPIAERLGFYKVARQMEDAVFKALQPTIHDMVAKWVRTEQSRKSPEIMRVVAEIRRDLEEKGIEVVENFYAKGIFAMHELARARGGVVDSRRLAEIPVFNLCLIVPDTDACFRTLNAVHSRFMFMPDGVRDFINNPKINGYQSLHTVVRGPGASRITVIIRTPEMDWNNHQGVIADIRAGRIHEGTFLRDLVESFDIINPRELLELTGRLFFREIDITSPAGQVFKMPEGSTALDFAYHIHTDVGHRAKGAIIGGRQRKLDTRLRAGQKVEIVKAKEPMVSSTWFSWVNTDRARLAIRKYLAKQERQALQAETGRFLAFLKEKIGLSLKESGSEMTALRDRLGFADLEQLGRAFFTGFVTFEFALGHLVPLLARRDQARVAKVLVRDGVLTREKLKEMESAPGGAMAEALGEIILAQVRLAHPPCEFIEIEGARHVIPVKFGQCCRPAFGDPIVGMAKRERGVTIHRDTCHSVTPLREMESIQLVAVRWCQSPGSRRVLVQVEGTDRRNLLHDLTRVLADFRVNIIELSIRTVEGEWFGGVVLLEVSDLTSTEMLVQRFNAVPSLKVTDTWDLP